MIIQLEDAKYKLQNMRANIDELASALRIDQLISEVEEEEKITTEPDFWNDTENSSRVLQKIKQKKDFDIVLLMVTDVLLDGSHMLYVGNDDIIHQAFNVNPKDKYVFLKGVMSRKKQIIPMLTALWG